jgi:hypothetical protein
MSNIFEKIHFALAGLVATLALVFVFAPTAVYADCANPANDNERQLCAAAASNERKKAACEGAAAAGVTDCGNADAATGGFKAIITTIINILSIIVGAVSVIMIIIGGFRYVISSGDSNAMSGAKNTILYAIIGLVVTLFAQIIVAFVIDRATAF